MAGKWDRVPSVCQLAQFEFPQQVVRDPGSLNLDSGARCSIIETSRAGGVGPECAAYRPIQIRGDSSYTMAAKVDKEKCVGCGPCAEACPLEAITITDNVAVVDEGTCIDCGQCVDACPSEAISVD